MRISTIPTILSLVLSPIVLCAENTAAEENASPQDTVFTSKLDGTEQRYVILLPPDFQPSIPHDVLIALHGHGSDRWQFVNDNRGECKGARDAAKERGMIFVSPDYRAKTSWMGPAAEADMLQILDELHGQFRIRNVVVSGGSMGGTSAMTFAALHPECVDGVVALNGTANLLEYPNFSEAISESYGGSKADKPEIYRQRSAELFPERLTMPIATTTGGKDTLVPADSTLRLMEALKMQGSPALSLHRPDGGHDTNYEDTRSAFSFVFESLDQKRSTEFTPVLRSFDSETTIVCLGDSVTGVYYHTGGHRAYPEMLELALRATHSDSTIRVINAGISGHTTSNGLARLDSDVLRHHPTVVTISFGLNDMVRVPPDEFRTNLEQLVDRCKSAESKVVLCTPNAVINTDGRPVTKLIEYCQIIRATGQAKGVQICDQYRNGERLQVRAPGTWRLTMSDAIHPNMDGHKRMAEELCRCISGAEISLDSIRPPEPVLARTKRLLSEGTVIKVLAMKPVATSAETAIRMMQPDAKIEMTVWDTSGKSLVQLEQDANAKVRSMKPDLVVLTIPNEATAESEEQEIHSISWIMNWSLSFGVQEWDCVVVHPSVLATGTDAPRAKLIRQLVHAQHLQLIDREMDTVASDEIIGRWFESELRSQSK